MSDGAAAERHRVLESVVKQELKCDREKVLAALNHSGHVLKYVPEELKSDRELVLAAVQQSGYALKFAADECKRDRALVLAAIKKDGGALHYAAEECRREKEIVLVAVKQDGTALRFAADECKIDHEIVLAAVKQDGTALKFAASGCKSDHDIVLAAMSGGNLGVLQYASEELLLDGNFVRDEKERCFILKVSLLSGRYLYLVVDAECPLFDPFIEPVHNVIESCLVEFGLEETGTEGLVHGDVVVPAGKEMAQWPGMKPLGQISEYQLVMGVREP